MEPRGQLPVVGAVAVGGVLGASARYGAALLWPTPAHAFPWTTFTVNAAGCAALGALMVLTTETATAPHPLLRPFLGTGFCGGFTTFSTYALDTQRLLAAGDPTRGLLYLAATAITALAAVWAGVTASRTVRARAQARARG
ncbi:MULTISPECIES: fluoride efflux transporter CrcB [Streptomyces]|uniref:Fluoride-specific ion channel FluC n=1 Tax=Streptomyces viridochromogenes TaxID=1938 RepID=A0A0L8KK17_STRVR|nr:MULTISPECIES: fluoride efflux transporter CrcB [Streptomyces]KOG26211.1 chromosome condensation protein CrcB [Streptomyces viridochromogenes]